MTKKSKNIEIKTQSNDLQNKSISKSYKEEESLNGSNIMNKSHQNEKKSRDYYKDLVLSVNQWLEEREIKIRPEQVFRKHISWKHVIQIMLNKNYEIKDANEIKRNWLEVCKYIKVERPLIEILSDCDQAIEKIFKAPTQSGYSIYQLEQRPRLREKYPNLKFIELHQKLAKRWNKLSEEQKKHYNDLAAEENRKNGVGLDRLKKKRKADNIKTESAPKTVENYNYPTTVLRDFYISVKASELKKSNPDLSYKQRRSLSSTQFSKCSITELTDIKKLYADHLQQFIDRVNQEDPQFISKIGQHIMETKKLRPLLEQPVISRFLSTINLADSNAKIQEHESSQSSDSEENHYHVEKYENSSLSSEEISDDN